MCLALFQFKYFIFMSGLCLLYPLYEEVNQGGERIDDLAQGHSSQGLEPGLECRQYGCRISAVSHYLNKKINQQCAVNPHSPGQTFSGPCDLNKSGEEEALLLSLRVRRTSLTPSWRTLRGS